MVCRVRWSWNPLTALVVDVVDADLGVELLLPAVRQLIPDTVSERVRLGEPEMFRPVVKHLAQQTEGVSQRINTLQPCRSKSFSNVRTKRNKWPRAHSSGARAYIHEESSSLVRTKSGEGRGFAVPSSPNVLHERPQWVVGTPPPPPPPPIFTLIILTLRGSDSRRTHS